jgi:uncharacterized protein
MSNRNHIFVSLSRLVILTLLLYGAPVWCADLAPLQTTVNDFAGMLPPASHQDLVERLKRFKLQTGHTVTIITVQTLEENIQSFAHQAFKRLPLDENELRNTVLLVVARKEHLVGFEAGAELQARFPRAESTRKLQSSLDLYINGLRPDLGIYGGVHFIFGVISGDFRAASATEEEALENASLHGAGAGGIFTLLLAPFLAFFVSMLLGIFSNHAGFQRETRLFLGIVFGAGTAQLVATLMKMISPFGDGLWYFIIVLSMILGGFASLTEYWMKGDWSGIPRVKDKHKRKPEDNMGI